MCRSFQEIRGALEKGFRRSVVAMAALSIASLSAACSSDQHSASNDFSAASPAGSASVPAEAAPAEGAQQTKDSSSSEDLGPAWPAGTCIPHTGDNPSLDDARLFFRQYSASSSGPAGRKLGEIPEDEFDHLTTGGGTSVASFPTYDFRYSDLKPTAIAYMSTVYCQRYNPSFSPADDWETWGPNTFLGMLLLEAQRGCDTRKGHELVPKGPDYYDWTQICS